MSSHSRFPSIAWSLARRVGVLVALSAPAMAWTTRAEAGSVTYTASTGSHDYGLLPLFPQGLGTLTRVDISADIGGGQEFLNDSQSQQVGTWSAWLGISADGIGDLGSGSATGTYSVAPGDIYFLQASAGSSLTYNSGLVDFEASPGGGSSTAFFAGYIGGLPDSFEAFGPSDAGADLTVTYDFLPLGYVPEPSGFVLGSIGLVIMAACARARAEKPCRHVG